MIDNNKVVLVTGGSKGIGRAMVDRFVEAGYNVAFSVTTRSLARLHCRITVTVKTYWASR